MTTPTAFAAGSRRVEIVLRGVAWGAVGGLAIAWVIMFIPIVCLLLPMTVAGDFSAIFYWLIVPFLTAGSVGVVQGVAAGVALAIFRRWTEASPGRAILVAAVAAISPPACAVGWYHQARAFVIAAIFAVVSVNVAIVLAPRVRWSRAERANRSWRAATPPWPESSGVCFDEDVLISREARSRTAESDGST